MIKFLKPMHHAETLLDFIKPQFYFLQKKIKKSLGEWLPILIETRLIRAKKDFAELKIQVCDDTVATQIRVSESALIYYVQLWHNYLDQNSWKIKVLSHSIFFKSSPEGHEIRVYIEIPAVFREGVLLQLESRPHAEIEQSFNIFEDDKIIGSLDVKLSLKKADDLERKQIGV